MPAIGELMTVNGEPVDAEMLTDAVGGGGEPPATADVDVDAFDEGDPKRVVGPNGFPENTPIKEMSLGEQAAYHKFQKRKAEARLHSVEKQLQAVAAEGESAVEAAREEARSAGVVEGLKVAAELELKRRAGWSDKDFDAVRDGINLAAFVTGSGLNEEKLSAFTGRVGASAAAPDFGADLLPMRANFRPVPMGNTGADVSSAKNAEMDRLGGR